ncbi:DUF3572 domain-containing protein [Afifella pfennigii]|uniref:DUF3572 domain-containing protein n=1 Tax=Afifella pfennigii TaxID=209897 RepID=UPI000691F326|nr:DUF3572 domain-containing protein [Afifella pfennigii]
MIQADDSSHERAEEIGIRALAHIAASPRLCARYLELTGLTAQSLRRAAGEPGFLAGTLAFLTAHEPDLIAFADSAGLRPEEIAEAAHRLEAGRPPGSAGRR